MGATTTDSTKTVDAVYPETAAPYSDAAPVMITVHKLNRNNYLQWRQSVFFFICGKGKDDYLTGTCSTDAQYFKKLVEEKRLYKFLLGLNDTFEEVCDRIIGRTPLPSLKEAFSEVRREESRKRINNVSNNPLEHSALATRGPSQQFPRQGAPTAKYCDYCHKKGHTKDTCWKIHGKPPNWKPRSRPSAAHNVETTAESQPFSQNQIEFFQKLFGQSSTSSGMPSTGHIAQSVKIADGTMVKVSGIGSVKISANLTLLNVLHMPTLTCNLLFVSKLTRDNHCVANFKSHGCFF
ncbi:Retrovirus-related Pol polyprotein from transposon RE1 [Senna tora]|uniref:Retrovirus-related Pol polyprotein from transposon RE1 n=1 Tax=Senna tora TaxID=362788 RepID=A0A834T3R1_9FABA|nr:Retrovirus-related Pol polyprotein from transposon RE1 [Senna tora]